jgi:hypothetical protein
LLLPKTQPPSADPLAYRPITLLPVLVRLLHKIIDQRLRAILFPVNAPPLLSRAQAGFVPGRSTHEQALILQQLGCSHQFAWAAFLDIQKAFDSFDRAELLDILRRRLPLEWVEVIRRLLSANSTTICGVRVELGRGCFQGSPLSPTLCMCFVDDLADALVEHQRQHPADFNFRLRPLAAPAAARILAYLLLFADDITIVADSREALQRLLNVVARWAARRRVRFSPKSGYACMRATMQAAPVEPVAPLALGPLAVPLLTGSVVYVGVPTWTYKPYSRWSKPHPLDLPDLTRLANALTHTFSLPGGQTYVRPQALLRGLHESILAKALYPTPVVDVDYAAVDKLIRSTARRILGLPPTFPSLLLYWELRLYPSLLLAHTRALRFANRFARQSWFYTCTISQAHSGPHASAKDLAYWTARGPLHRLTRLLELYADPLFGPDGPTAPGERWARVATMEPVSWTVRVDTAIYLAYRRWCDDQLNDYPTAYREILGLTLSVPGPLPKYMQHGGNRARAVLRLKSPALRMHFHAQPLARCAWCSTGPEEGMHLLACPQQPVDVRDKLRPVLVAIAQAGPISPHYGVDEILHSRLLSMDWGGQRTRALLRGVEALAFLLNRYRLATPADDATGLRPVWPVSTEP